MVRQLRIELSEGTVPCGSDTSTAGPASVRWLHIHDASQFGALSGPSFLTRFALRPDTILGQSGPRSLTLRVYASTTSRSVAGLSTTFAENFGTDNTLVFDGTVNLTTGNLPGPGNTRKFDYVFPFTTPFLYDPAAGNLVLDLQIEGDGSAVTFDTVSGDSAIGRVFSFGSSTATTGDIWAFPHVTQFTFAPPPRVTIRMSQIDVCWNSISNLTYQVQYRSDLTTNLWTSLVDCVRSTGSTTCIVDPIVVGQPQRFYRVEVRTPKGRVLAATPLARAAKRFGVPGSVCVHRADILSELMRRSDPARVRLRSRCVGFAERDGRVVAHFADGHEAHADFLVGADGLRSAVQARLFGESPPRYAGYTCWRGVASLEQTALPPDTAFEAREQFAKQHAEAVDVAARVNVHAAHLRLLGTHVGRRASASPLSPAGGCSRKSPEFSAARSKASTRWRNAVSVAQAASR